MAGVARARARARARQKARKPTGKKARTAQHASQPQQKQNGQNSSPPLSAAGFENIYSVLKSEGQGSPACPPAAGAKMRTCWVVSSSTRSPGRSTGYWEGTSQELPVEALDPEIDTDPQTMRHPRDLPQLGIQWLAGRCGATTQISP